MFDSEKRKNNPQVPIFDYLISFQGDLYDRDGRVSHLAVSNTKDLFIFDFLRSIS